MLIIKDNFIISPSDASRLRDLDKLKEGRKSGKFTPAECIEINRLWDKYPLDGWCDGIGPSIIQSEMPEMKGRSQKKENIKLNLLIWTANLPAQPSLDWMYSQLMVRYAARRIYHNAYVRRDAVYLGIH